MCTNSGSHWSSFSHPLGEMQQHQPCALYTNRAPFCGWDGPLRPHKKVWTRLTNLCGWNPMAWMRGPVGACPPGLSSRFLSLVVVVSLPLHSLYLRNSFPFCRLATRTSNHEKRAFSHKDFWCACFFPSLLCSPNVEFIIRSTQILGGEMQWMCITITLIHFKWLIWVVSVTYM